jgi:hypothetical protein
MGDDADDEIICATYTHARRHPMVLGNIGGWTPPFQLTLVQVAVLIVAYVIEVQTWPLWGAHLPVSVGLVIGGGLPCLLAWAVRRTRIEGRSLPRLAVGWIQWLTMPRNGQVGGRPYRPERASAPLGGRLYVASGEEAG